MFDKRGDAWVGPGYFRFQLKTEPASAGSIESGMYRFRLPNRTTVSEDGVGGIRKGNAWTKPEQTAFPGIKTQFTGSSMWSAYDPKKDAVVFATKWPRLWPGRFGSHDLWHVFVLGGSACHWALMLLCVVPSP